ncbi:carbon storage regulator [Planctomyces sp. SH-PL14]|uniref:carbon storage regulator n=1 Tax=Planctomyces sp. SH-PL14 TaxID=1632864 RepID=UPI00078D1BB3|nr:carbon storage regulator [Planctomyces sp. SH-PL14]AMV18877.1 carbon storage regulator [Planctomyces sp. SH-PL14]
MLVLSRHRDERVVITDTATGERLEVLCVEIRGDKVRLGFEASKRFAIHRGEIQELVDQGVPPRATPSPAARPAGGMP